MVLPSDEQLELELLNLSSHLYSCIYREDDLAPTKEEWDKWRNRRWSPSRSILKAFGLPANRKGWTRLVESFGFLCPTLSEARLALLQRKIEMRQYPPYYDDEDEYPGLTGTTREEVYYETLSSGEVRKVTRTYTSIR